MEAKKCQYCNGEITGKRDDAKFCSNTCKAKRWEQKKVPTSVKEEINVANQLRGLLNVDDSTQVVPPTLNTEEIILKTVDVNEFNLDRVPLELHNRRLTGVRKTLVMEISFLKAKLKQVTSLNGEKWIVGFTGVGAFVGNKSAQEKTKGTLVGAAFGLLTGIIAADATKKNREEDKKQVIQKLLSEIKNRETLLENTKTEMKILKEELQTTPLFNIVQKQIPVTNQTSLQDNNPLKLSQSDPEIEKAVLRGKIDVSDDSLTTNSDKIISSENLKKMEFKALNFHGKWNALFGYPSINFHCVVHGMSGEGKSTFSIKFAKYLADNFGRVIYISGEEGFSKTFKDKFSNNNAESKFLDVADLRTYDDLVREIPTECYNFIFIDSLDNMKIDADKMKKIRARYKNSALVTISQSTKDGKMRGSYEIVHDSDIAVKVENGIATTTKNRFKEKAMTFDVFESKE